MVGGRIHVRVAGFKNSPGPGPGPKHGTECSVLMVACEPLLRLYVSIFRLRPLYISSDHTSKHEDSGRLNSGQKRDSLLYKGVAATIPADIGPSKISSLLPPIVIPHGVLCETWLKIQNVVAKKHYQVREVEARTKNRKTQISRPPFLNWYPEADVCTLVEEDRWKTTTKTLNSLIPCR